MAFSTNKKQKLFTEINITPLTDIFLVLLIIMMVVAPSFQFNGQCCRCACRKQRSKILKKSKVTVSVTQDWRNVMLTENQQMQVL